MRPQTTTLALLEEWDTALPTLRELAKASPDDGTPLTELRPLPPVQPRQLPCAGANYFQHVREISFSFRKNSGDERPDDFPMTDFLITKSRPTFLPTGRTSSHASSSSIREHSASG